MQRGLQVNLVLDGDRAAFLRVLGDDATAQTALVLLNKGDRAARFALDDYIEPGAWRDALGGAVVTAGDGGVSASVPAHGVRVLVRDGAVRDPALRAELARLQRALSQ